MTFILDESSRIASGMYIYSNGELEITLERRLTNRELEEIEHVEDLEELLYIKAQYDLDSFLETIF